MVRDVREAEALSRKLIEAMGRPLPSFGPTFFTRYGKVTLKTDEAMRILEKDLRDEPDA